MANPKLDKVKKGTTVISPEQQKAIDSYNATKQARIDMDREEDKRYSRGTPDTWVPKTASELAGKDMSNASTSDLTSTLEDARKKHLNKTRNSALKSDAYSRGGGM